MNDFARATTNLVVS